ncbi:hypothetical protein EI555_008968 [Monodon monoceros]|uniref:Protein chibby homolog 1 n=1 Tax=Monodon monoceros TaxID=40151 RepID=A0A4V5P847_MONMO|nr:hypothetical protein EI555_008968 [Monodon monoceros]
MDKICTEKEQKRELNAGGKASFRARMMRPEFAFETTEGLTGEESIDLSFIRPKMPLFGSTFSPKKTPPRKSASLSNLHNLDRSTREVELGLDYGTPTMNLAGQSLKFENGQWIAETGVSGGVDRREAQRLRRRNQQLEEENNLLRLKVDILLDMLSETTAESHLMEKELDELKSVSRRRK